MNKKINCQYCEISFLENMLLNVNLKKIGQNAASTRKQTITDLRTLILGPSFQVKFILK